MTADARQLYIGRFAPSPTGPLHFGSLVAALASYLQARSQGGSWYLRIEDIDPPREVTGATDDIIRTLEKLGFEWDGTVQYQSARLEAYAQALDQLSERALIYACTCSRREIATRARNGVEGPVYPGTCRDARPISGAPKALRVRTDNHPIRFTDLLQGPQEQQLERDVGDFVLRRADGLFSYQLVVVVDDACWGTTEVVRGSDLLLSTPRQIHLQNLLGLPTPAYVHLPIAVDTRGDKLSKQTHAAPIQINKAVTTLCAALTFLGQQPPASLQQGSQDDVWQWAKTNWDLNKVPAKSTLPAPDAL